MTYGVTYAVESTGETAFFEYARARQAIYDLRASGSAPPWTQDPILRWNRFCNVFREDDKTTAWFRTHVREPLRAADAVVPATVLFRWFNRITSGEAMFCQRNLFDGLTAFEVFISSSGRVEPIERALLNYIGSAGPFITAAHLVKVEPGLPMPYAVLSYFKEFARQEWAQFGAWCRGKPATLQEAVDWLKLNVGIGRFLAYEIATDLRHTTILEKAPDIMTWCSRGPGSERGFGRVFFDNPEVRTTKDDFIAGCNELLIASQNPRLWPYAQWWEMRDVEHTLCEFDKYIRIRRGEGKMKGIGKWEV